MTHQGKKRTPRKMLPGRLQTSHFIDGFKWETFYVRPENSQIILTVEPIKSIQIDFHFDNIRFRILLISGVVHDSHCHSEKRLRKGQKAFRSDCRSLV